MIRPSTVKSMRLEAPSADAYASRILTNYRRFQSGERGYHRWIAIDDRLRDSALLYRRYTETMAIVRSIA